MSRYHFAIDHGAFCHQDEAGTELPDDSAAWDYALRVIRELKEGGGYDDPQLKMIVTNSSERAIFTIPFARRQRMGRGISSSQSHRLPSPMIC